MSYCIELSTLSEDRGRLHIHAVFSNAEGRQDIGLPASWKFQGSTPDLRANSVNGRGAAVAVNRAHYYAQAPKIGRICGWANYIKHQHLAVDPRWVAGLWKLRKLTHSTAIQEMLEARGNIARNFAEISFVAKKEEEQADEVECSIVNQL